MEHVWLWHAHIAVQPFARHGLVVGVGFARASIHGSATIQQVATSIGFSDAVDVGDEHFDLSSRLHLVEAEVGWEWRLGHRLTIGISVGAFFTSSSRAHVTLDPPLDDPRVDELGRLAADELEHAYSTYVKAPLLSSFVGYEL